MIGRVNTSRPSTKYSIARWCATIGQNYTTLDTIPEVVMRDLMTKYASVAYFLEWYSADNSMIDAFIANQYAMKWIGLRDYICDKLMYYGQNRDANDTDNARIVGWTVPSACPIQNYVADGKLIQKVGRVDLGTLSYVRYTISQSGYFVVTGVSPLNKTYGGTVLAKLYCDGYQTRIATDITSVEYDKSIGASGEAGRILITNFAYTDATAFKSAMSGTYLYYELAEPIVHNYGHSEIGDKMLGSEYWEYILKDHVPIMTSDSAPYGSCSASSAHSGYNAYKAFDNDSSTSWVSYDETQPSIIYNFTNPTKINAISEIPYYSSYFRVKGFTVSGSNDGNTWTPIYSGVSAESNTEQFFKFANENYYMMCKVQITSEYASLSSSGKGFTKLQFYGRSLNVSVPTMTSDTSPYGVAESSGTQDSVHFAYQAFNHIINGWQSAIVSSTTATWLRYKFTKPTVVKAVYLNSQGSSTYTQYFNPFSVTVQGSNDGEHFVDFDTFNITTTSEGKGLRIVTNNTPYLYYRLLYNNPNFYQGGKYYTVANDIQFYGVDYSERTDRTYLYDHGLEFENVWTYEGKATSATGTASMTKLDNYMDAKSECNSTADGAWYTCYIYPQNQIDFSPFTKMCANIRTLALGDGNKDCGVMGIQVGTTISSVTAAQQYAVKSSQCFIEYNLDITNVNGNYLPIVYIHAAKIWRSPFEVAIEEVYLI